MTETKVTHSPGPWTFTAGDANRREMSRIHKADDRDFLIGYVITEATNPHQRKEDLANARILAAAPTMYDLLRRLAKVPSIYADEKVCDLIDDARTILAEIDNAAP